MSECGQERLRELLASFFDAEEAAAQEPVVTEEDIRKSFEHVLQGAYFQVPDHMLQVLAEKLTPFLDYVARRSDTGRTGTDNS